jgi:hypothetical protein
MIAAKAPLLLLQFLIAIAEAVNITGNNGALTFCFVIYLAHHYQMPPNNER